jgi:class 3 adenylate cyclase/streptogramin lyase
MTLPSGTVTFLFTDIEGSTELVRRLRDRYHEVLADHQGLIRAAVAEAGGSEIDSQGDAFFFVFRRAREAVLAAANAQRALASHEWPEDGLVRVRMGIHTGEAGAVDGCYHGVAVHRAARISAAGHGGQVLLSQTTHNLLEDEEELPLDLRDLGEQRLKDFERPVRIYQLVIPGLQERFPPLRTGEQAPPGRLPAALGEANRRKRLLLGAAAAAVAAALAVILETLGGSGSVSVGPHSVAVIDPTRNAVVAGIDLGSAPAAVTAGEGAVWAVSTEAKTLSKIDPVHRRVSGSVAVPGIPSDVAAGQGSVWVLHSASPEPALLTDAQVSQFDPRYLGLQRTDATGGDFDGSGYADPIAVADDAWVANAGGTAVFAQIIRIDQSTGKPNGDLPVHILLSSFLAGRKAGGLAVDRTAAWAVNGDGMIRIDPETMEKAQVSGPGSSGPGGDTIAFLVAARNGSVWAAGERVRTCNDVDLQRCKRLGGILWRIDPGSNSVDEQTSIGRLPVAIALGEGAVWVADRETKAVWRIDPRTLDVVKKIDLGRTPVDVTVGAGSVWVGVRE